MKKVDCIIVGGGMVGAATAIALADTGLTVAIFERKEPVPFEQSQPFDLRVSAISVASEQLLSTLGAWQMIEGLRSCPYRKLGVWESELSYAEFDSSTINQPRLGHIIENRLIQLSLWQLCIAHRHIEIILGDEIKRIEQEQSVAQVTTDNNQFQAKLVIAADGASSFTRKLAGIGCTGWNYNQSAMLINVETQLPQQDITWQQFTPTGPVAMLPMPGNNASLVWYHQRDKIKQLAQLSNEELTEQIHLNFPERLGKVKVVDKGYFPLTRQHANQYYAGRVVLVGDAAHSINPLAGQGVNLGFKDVKALQQVIASAIADGKAWDSVEVLSNYQSARRKDNQLMMTAMDSLYATFSNDSPILKAVRNFGLFAAQRAPILKDKVLSYACGL